jgi:hypothetical protein
MSTPEEWWCWFHTHGIVPSLMRRVAGMGCLPQPCMKPATILLAVLHCSVTIMPKDMQLARRIRGERFAG